VTVGDKDRYETTLRTRSEPVLRRFHEEKTIAFSASFNDTLKIGNPFATNI